MLLLKDDSAVSDVILYDNDAEHFLGLNSTHAACWYYKNNNNNKSHINFYYYYYYYY